MDDNQRIRELIQELSYSSIEAGDKWNCVYRGVQTNVIIQAKESRFYEDHLSLYITPSSLNIVYFLIYKASIIDEMIRTKWIGSTVNKLSDNLGKGYLLAFQLELLPAIMRKRSLDDKRWIAMNLEGYEWE